MSTMDSALLQADVETEQTAVEVRRLIVHNDDYNTFEWVIETLMSVCKHSAEQAEQCSYIIHSKGKYAVKHGTYKTLRPMKEAIAERGINVTIE